MLSIFKNIIRCAVIASILAVGAWFGIGYWQDYSAGWPKFPDANPAAPVTPQVVVQATRDYGWRTGDAIPVVLYIHQMPGTVVDTSNIAIKGDFEVRTQPKQLVAKHLSDGSDVIKLRFTVQSFNVSKSWTLDANMTYKVVSSGDAETVSLPGLKLYTSLTYDGRGDIQPGPQTTQIDVAEQMLTVSVLVVGLLVFVWGFVWHGRLVKRQAKVSSRTPLQTVQHNYAVLMKRIEAGDRSSETYEELERNVRWLYKLEPQTRGQIELEVEMNNHPFQKEITTIISLCDKRIYDGEPLTDDEHKAIADAFKRIFTSKPAPHAVRTYGEGKPIPTVKPKE
jgi:hypothetical protein